MTNENLFKVGLKLLALLFVLYSLQTLVNGVEALYIRLFIIGNDNFSLLIAGMSPDYMPDVLMILRAVIIITVGLYLVFGNIDWLVTKIHLYKRLIHNSK